MGCGEILNCRLFPLNKYYVLNTKSKKHKLSTPDNNVKNTPIKNADIKIYPMYKRKQIYDHK